MANKSSVIVLVGLPGSGKSVARAYAASTGISADAYQYSTDDKVEEMANQAGISYNEGFDKFIKEATRISNIEVGAAIENMQNIVWDQTNLSIKKRQNILNRFSDAYTKVCMCILPPANQHDADELERRLNSRPGKNIPSYVMANMRKSFEHPTVDEGFDKVYLFDMYGKMKVANEWHQGIY